MLVCYRLTTGGITARRLSALHVLLLDLIGQATRTSAELAYLTRCREVEMIAHLQYLRAHGLIRPFLYREHLPTVPLPAVKPRPAKRHSFWRLLHVRSIPAQARGSYAAHAVQQAA